VTRRAENLMVTVGYGLARRGLPASASFRRWVEAALRGARRRKPAIVAIRLVGSVEGRKLNREYRGKDYATNVLSFPAEPVPGIGQRRSGDMGQAPSGDMDYLPLLGDLALCAPVVLREAAEQGKPPAHHWAHLTIHGVLHLLGHDHLADADAERMEALETRILATLGIPDPYR
jgi:probable rRNA maturation factor